MEQKSAISEDMGNLKFKSMLRTFEKIIDGTPPPEKVKGTLKSLKEAATKSGELAVRQAEAIGARCDNYMAGCYGNTKKPEHYAQAATPTK